MDAYIGYPNLERQAKKTRTLWDSLDINDLPDPRTYAFVSGLLGEPPEEQGFSVLHPDAEGIRSAGDAGYVSGLAGNLIPAKGALGLFGMAIDPKAQKRLVQGLLAGGGGDRFRLGDLKPSQTADLLKYSNVRPATNDVFVSPKSEHHVYDGRIVEDGFKAQEAGLYAKQAMRPDSMVMPPAKPGDYPALFSQRMRDPVTGQSYNAMMPLQATEDGFEMVTLIPKGLQKRKTPKR